MILENNRFIRALLKQPVDRTPCWMMRQAGRYLPEYRATREKAGSFMALCQNPDLACEVTLQPLRRFDFDAAILFSDILTIPDAMGLGLSFAEGEGPRFANPIRSLAQIDNLAQPDPEVELKYVMDAVRTIKRELNGKVPLIGFSGSPWTLATYMIEGGSSKEFGRVKGLMFENPKSMHILLTKIAQSVTDYLNAQIKAGAQVIQIFDTWGGLLSKANYLEFSLKYMSMVIAGLIKDANGMKIPVILFTKGGGAWLPEMADSGADCLGLDWMTEISDARVSVGHKVALQGNMDPAVLYATPEIVRSEVKKVLMAFSKIKPTHAMADVATGHIFNLGHGIHPRINPENVKAMVEAVREFSPVLHYSTLDSGGIIK